MIPRKYNVAIQGYWRDRNKAGIPIYSGVYFVYTAIYNEISKNLSLGELIYIGESENVNSRIQNHEKYETWISLLSDGQELCFSTAVVHGDDRTRVEAAYIFKHKPQVNIEYKNSFPFNQTTIISTGKTILVNINFTVNKT